ncbi:MAG: hypothetical protein M1834_008002 [Cirrosporium novae-zelandiae]|nr:MAG: hypothetical protein M1834_008002 [Cirrosporium novae-zelandiae]
MEDDWQHHLRRNVALISLSLFFLPIDTFILAYALAFRYTISLALWLLQQSSSQNTQRRTVLVTGVGTPEGLMLAREFHSAGHRVIGADFEPYGIPVCGRFSRALGKFYRLPRDPTDNYISSLIAIVQIEGVDLWISCSGVATAMEDAQAKEKIENLTDCKALQHDLNTTATLCHKDSFLRYTAELGFPVLEARKVTSRNAVHHTLNRANGKRYVMNTLGDDDALGGNVTILPRDTLSRTYDYVSKLEVTKEKPWILQQVIEGEQYCTHALIIRGEVKAFVACPSSKFPMHYKALPQKSALKSAMLKFTQEFADRSGLSMVGSMTGHLSFDFVVDEQATEAGVETKIFPIGCNPTVHTAVMLLHDQGQQMVRAYLEILLPQVNGFSKGRIIDKIMPENPRKYYWIGNDLVTLVLHPLSRLLRGMIPPEEFTQGSISFLKHVLLWKDGTFEVWDPLPWWVLYHIYWPGKFIGSTFDPKRWTKINVRQTEFCD